MMTKVPKSPTPKKLEDTGPFAVRTISIPQLEYRLNEAYRRGWDVAYLHFDHLDPTVVFRKSTRAMIGIKHAGPFDADDPKKVETDD